MPHSTLFLGYNPLSGEHPEKLLKAENPFGFVGFFYKKMQLQPGKHGCQVLD